MTLANMMPCVTTSWLSKASSQVKPNLSNGRVTYCAQLHMAACAQLVACFSPDELNVLLAAEVKLHLITATTAR